MSVPKAAWSHCASRCLGKPIGRFVNPRNICKYNEVGRKGSILTCRNSNTPSNGPLENDDDRLHYDDLKNADRDFVNNGETVDVDKDRDGEIEIEKNLVYPGTRNILSFAF